MDYDRETVSAICHGSLPFHNPIDPDRLDALLAPLGLGPEDRVLDLGCGPGELLVRLAERTGAGGVGIDLAGGLIAEARRRAAERAPNAALEFLEADAGAVDLPAHGFTLTACIGSTHAAGGLDAVLARMAALTAPGGWVVVGDGYWRRPPGQAYLDVLGATADELPDYPGLMRAGEPHGLVAVDAVATTEQEWDRYEWGNQRRGDAHVRAHAGEPGVERLQAWVDAARDRYLSEGGRDTLGFALVLLRPAG
jgi:SAM-dependent methyltransferase